MEINFSVIHSRQPVVKMEYNATLAKRVTTVALTTLAYSAAGAAIGALLVSYGWAVIPVAIAVALGGTLYGVTGLGLGMILAKRIMPPKTFKRPKRVARETLDCDPVKAAREWLKSSDNRAFLENNVILFVTL